MNYQIRNKGRNWWGQTQMYDSTLESVAPSQARSIIKNHINKDIASTVFQRLYQKSDAKSFINAQGASSLMMDAFNHWHAPSKDYKIEPDKYWWHNLLQKVDNHLLQFATNGNAGFSYMAASHIIEVINKLYKKYGDDLKDKIGEYNKSCQNGTPIDGDLEKDLNSFCNAAKNKIRKDIDKMENNRGCGKSKESVSIEMVDLLTDPRLTQLVNIKESNLRSFLKTTIDKATQSVSGKSTIIEESLFDSDDIEDLINIENFAHVALFDDLTTRYKQYHVSFDVYIDDSGSMDSSFRLGDDYSGPSVTYRNLSRMVAFKLHELGILRDTYLFSHQDTLTKIENEHLFSAHIGGGTDIAQCIKNSQEIGRPSIIITDGWDQLPEEHSYYKDCFVLILDCRSADKSFKTLVENKQVLFYNGTFSDAVFDSDGDIVSAEYLKERAQYN